jgi:hypothetical protein
VSFAWWCVGGGKESRLVTSRDRGDVYGAAV